VTAITAPATDAARQWQGWGTALKPASEPIIVARKPLTGTVAATVLAHGTGALNVDACRVGRTSGRRSARSSVRARDDTADPAAGSRGGERHGREQRTHARAGGRRTSSSPTHPTAPTCAWRGARSPSWTRKAGRSRAAHGAVTGARGGSPRGLHAARAKRTSSYGDQGGASRFFPTFRYQAKAPTSERPKIDGQGWPTVKPLALMRWLVRLVTPPGGLVLDPFAGSGTTGEAAVMEGFNAVLIERDPTYLPLIEQRRTRRQADTSGDQLTLVGR
jgi:hypothetical protein